MTYTYEVCKTQSGGPDYPDLSHWLLELCDLECAAEGDVTLAGLVAGITGGTLGLGDDGSTGRCGVKWNDLTGSGCATYTITLDESALPDGYALGIGPVGAVLKAGSRFDTGTVCGPICVVAPEDECWDDETAWSAGTRYTARGNWATYTGYSGSARTVTLFAGQTMNAGTVTFSAPSGGNVTITITLAAGWRFADGVQDTVKIQGYSTTPSGNPAPGSFPHKATPAGSPFSIDVPQATFYGVHVDVEREVDCP